MTPLRQRMLEDMQVRNLSPHTQRAYVENVARFARHFGRSPADLGPEEIRTYQVYLIRERHLAPSSLEIAVCALRFLYKVSLKKPWSFDDLIPAPKKPRRLPVVLSPDEVVRALDGVDASHVLPTTVSQSQFTILGIRCMARRFSCSAACGMAARSGSVSMISPLPRFQSG
jgi:integrase/recombinase XerD